MTSSSQHLGGPQVHDWEWQELKLEFRPEIIAQIDLETKDVVKREVEAVIRAADVQARRGGDQETETARLVGGKISETGKYLQKRIQNWLEDSKGLIDICQERFSVIQGQTSGVEEKLAIINLKQESRLVASKMKQVFEALSEAKDVETLKEALNEVRELKIRLTDRSQEVAEKVELAEQRGGPRDYVSESLQQILEVAIDILDKTASKGNAVVEFAEQSVQDSEPESSKAKKLNLKIKGRIRVELEPECNSIRIFDMNAPEERSVSIIPNPDTNTDPLDLIEKKIRELVGNNTVKDKSKAILTYLEVLDELGLIKMEDSSYEEMSLDQVLDNIFNLR